MRVLSTDIAKHIGKEAEIQGWLHKKRLLGGLNFINIRDRGGLVQMVVEDKKEVEKLRGLHIGTVLKVKGKVFKEERAPGGAELREPHIEVLVPVTEEPPVEIDKPLSHKPDNLDTLFDNRVIGLRNLQETAIFRIQAKVLEAAREYFIQNGFTEMNTPKLLSGATEGGAEVFKLDYFGKEATLAQSAQFYKQMMVGVFERVFETNPTYRAEPSATTRHMTEYITIDAEMGFVTFEELRDFTGGLLRHIVEKVWKDCGPELKMWNAQKPVLAEPIPSLTMAQIHELYSKATGTKTVGEEDLRPDEEKWICDYAKKNLGSEAVYVTEWPVSSMKFYHKVNEKNPKVADRSDLLFRGVEIATVPMREHRYEVLVKQLKELAKGDPEHPGFKYYLQAFKYGLPPHGGFGWGLERTVEKLLNLNNVKEATLFPRDINRLAP
ncbi:MAG TPA: aspartate--tRNA(Asn) ligase [Candidatus Saccharimonadales bacterium]|nr:aspartate--tRNA(Asn) ligase [Candidatus Saccharimonadales bacterium]